MRSERPIRSIEDLARAELIEPDQRTALAAVAQRYAIAITPAMAELIESPDDPIGRQFVPSACEVHAGDGEQADPIGDGAHSPVPGIVHRYPDRVLLKPLLACPVYCRFCFRREVVGDAGALDAAALDRALDYIRATPAIWEVILSGGDPLLLSERRLRAILGALDAIEHVETVRIHTRVPVVAPERVTEGLVQALRQPTPTWVVLHTNHVRELTENALAACARLVDAGVPMLSQTVLLRGINDTPEALSALLRKLVAHRIKPYYLHHPDLAPGTAHFRTTLEAGRALTSALRGRLSGLCQPTYVLDIPGGFGKVPVGDAWAWQDAGGWLVRDVHGIDHRYPPGEDR